MKAHNNHSQGDAKKRALAVSVTENTMKPIHVVATIVRLFAVCLIIYVANLATFTVSLGAGNESSKFMLLSFLLIFAIAIVACFLWFFPMSISRKLTGMPVSKDDENFTISGVEFTTVCFFTLGLYFLYGLIGEGVYWVKILNDPMVQEMQSELSSNQRASLWAFGFRAIFAIFLLLGNQVLVRFFRRLRYAG